MLISASNVFSNANTRQHDLPTPIVKTCVHILAMNHAHEVKINVSYSTQY